MDKNNAYNSPLLHKRPRSHCAKSDKEGSARSEVLPRTTKKHPFRGVFLLCIYGGIGLSLDGTGHVAEAWEVFRNLIPTGLAGFSPDLMH